MTDPEKTTIQKDNTCTPMFIAALLTIARTWKQPKCPSTDGRKILLNKIIVLLSPHPTACMKVIKTLCQVRSQLPPYVNVVKKKKKRKKYTLCAEGQLEEGTSTD